MMEGSSGHINRFRNHRAPFYSKRRDQDIRIVIKILGKKGKSNTNLRE